MVNENSSKRSSARRPATFLFCAGVALLGLTWGAVQGRQQQVPFQVGGLLRDAVTREPISEGAVSYACWGPDGPVRDGLRIDNAEGSFLLRGLPRCALFLVASGRGYGRAVSFVIVDPAEVTEVELLLPPGGSVSGVVVDADGAPVGGAEVTVRYEDRLKDRLAHAPELVQQAREEGLDIYTFEFSPLHRGQPYTGAREGKEIGVFTINDIDPDRPFRLAASHPELGTVTTSTTTLVAGEEKTDYRLQYLQ